MEEIQKMCFVGKKNVNYVIPGMNISSGLIAVAFLIWDSIMWALEIQQHPAGLLMQNSEVGPRKWMITLWNTVRCFIAAQLPSKIACNPWKFCNVMASWNYAAWWKEIFHFATWYLLSNHSQNSSSTYAASSAPQNGAHGDFARAQLCHQWSAL